MKKLQVFKAIGMTFAFIAQHIVDVLIIVWLPLALQTAAFFLLVPGYTATMMRMQMDGPPQPEAMGEMVSAFGQFGVFMVVVLATSVALSSGLTKLIVKGEKPKLPFYLGWGGDEWRVLGGCLLFGLIVVGLQVAAVLISVVARSVLGGGVGSAVIGLVVTLAGLVASIWISVRLSMLIPVTVDTGKIGLRESWERTEDDFWPLVGYWVLFILGALVVSLLLLGYLTPPGVFDAYSGMNPREPESMREVMRKVNEATLRGYDLSDMANVVRLLVGVLLGALGGIIVTVAGAVAWRMISDDPKELAETF